MKPSPEIMAPVGSYESLAVAIKAGANSVYFGIGKLNMRSASAVNFTIKDLNKIVKICKKAKVKTYLTLNTIMYGSDLENIKKIADAAKKAGITAIIAMDMAVILYANSINLEVHMSTQTNISNIEAVKFYSQFADVIVLARELSIIQIKKICNQIKKQKITGPKGELIKIEIFIHGALCVSISGKCYMSLAIYNKSANRGQCLQTCRRSYKVRDTETGDELSIDNKYVMSPKDLCTLRFLPEILDTGVAVLKIEGRGRSPDYVYTVVETYKKAIEDYKKGKLTKTKIQKYESHLSEVFNRGFWHGGYYLGKKLGEWAGIYGSASTKTKHFIGVVKHYFPKAKIAEIEMQKESLKIGDKILITGPTTGVVKDKIKSLYKNEKPVKDVVKGDVDVTFPISELVRKNDKVYVIKKRKKSQA
ncbi:MAG: peptidase U32 family protein [Nanoarchaeota archaeon]|nr:peptidase U32 family protein [Nanoarchaeota archaeon]